MTSIDDVIRLLEAANNTKPAVSSKGQAPSKTKKKRKVSTYQKNYGAAFKKLAPKYKTKKGSWKKGGFKRAQKEAHKEARRRTK